MLYEKYPNLIFEEQNFLIYLLLPLLITIIGLFRKKIIFTGVSSKLKNQSKSNDDNSNPIESLLADSSNSEPNADSNSDIDKLIADSSNSEPNADSNSDIDKLIASATTKEDSEIDELISDATKEDTNGQTTFSDNSIDVEMMIQEKYEPLEKDMESIKGDFDEFKTELVNVKEEINSLSSSFENTMTDLKNITTDLNNPLNFMKEDTFEKNIQTIDVNKLKKTPEKSIEENNDILNPEPAPVETEPAPVETEPAPVETEPLNDVSKKSNLNGYSELFILLEELLKNFNVEQVLELAKIHCKNYGIQIPDDKITSVIKKIKENNNQSSDLLESELSTELV